MTIKAFSHIAADATSSESDSLMIYANVRATFSMTRWLQLRALSSLSLTNNHLLNGETGIFIKAGAWLLHNEESGETGETVQGTDI